MTWRSPRLLAACRQIECQNCGRDDGTVCAAHRNQGKGMALKVSDALVAALCHSCHAELDQGSGYSRDERRAVWDRAYILTCQQLLERGLVKVT